MGIGFSRQYTESVPLNGLTAVRFIALLQQAAKSLNWRLVFSDHQSALFETKLSWYSWGEEVRVRLDASYATIESKCKGSQVVDWGRNKKNVAAILVRFHELKEAVEAGAGFTGEEAEVFFELEAEQNETILFKTDPAPGRGLMPSKQFAATPALVVINLVVFIVMALSGVDILYPDAQELARWGGNYREGTMAGEWWRLITCCFIHAGILHLLFNMGALLYIGIMLEPILGWLRFLLAYLMTGLVASAASIWWHSATVSIGASGAIFGMFGVFLSLLTTRLMEPSVRRGLLLSLLAFVGYNLVSGIKSQVDNAAHLGGLLSGFLFGYLYYPGLKFIGEYKLKFIGMGLFAIFAMVAVSVFVRLTPVGGFEQYQARMADFTSMEATAMSSVYDMPPETDEDEKLFAIREHGLLYWDKCLDELYAIKRLDIPPPLVEVNKKLIIYCKKRKESFEWMYKRLVEHSKQYDADIRASEEALTAMMTEIKASLTKP